MNALADIAENLKDFDLRELFSTSGIITSLFLIGAIVIVRGFLVRYVRKDSEILDKEQRRWIIRIKNTSMILLLIGLVLIWAPQLHTFALSIAAFAVALVVATKEMILCLTGAIMRTTSQPFKVGEWITIDGITGEVIDLDVFSFRLQEVDMEGKTFQFTGRTITVPNSKLFTSNVENANFFKTYIYEDVRIAVQFGDVDPDAAMFEMKDVAEKNFAPYRNDAVAFNRKIRRRAGIDIGAAEPVFDLTTSELGHYQFHTRFFLPTALASSVGSEVSRDFLKRIHDLRKKSVQDNKEEQEAVTVEQKSKDD